MAARRQVFQWLGMALTLPLAGWAQPAFPNRPLRIVCPFAPGGGSDFISRVVSAKLSERLGQPVVVENRPGAGGSLGTELALKSPADGYTMLLIAGSYTVNPGLRRLPYDPVADITPVIQLSQGAYVLCVRPDLPVRSLAELIKLMQSQPGRLSFASSGTGGHLHVVTEYLLSLAQCKATHVPYKGTGPALTDLLSGSVDMLFAGTEAVMSHVATGKLRALAVSTSKRLAAYPDIPSVAESGLPAFDVLAWHGLVAPRGLPAPVLQRLSEEINAVLQAKELVARIEPTGVSPAGGSPAQFGQLIKAEIDRYGKVIRDAGIKAE